MLMMDGWLVGGGGGGRRDILARRFLGGALCVILWWRCGGVFVNVTVRRDSRKVQMFGTLFVERKYPV